MYLGSRPEEAVMTDDPRALAAKLLAASSYAMPLADAIEHIRKRRSALALPPSPAAPPDLVASSAVPLPIVDDPEQFAADFWKRRLMPEIQKTKLKPPLPGRRPAGETHAHPDLRVIDGGKDDGDNTT